jgi:hypothetical protein
MPRRKRNEMLSSTNEKSHLMFEKECLSVITETEISYFETQTKGTV